MPKLPLVEFCHEVARVVAHSPASEAPAIIAEMLPRVLGDRDLLSPSQKALPATGYGRHEVFLCPHDAFSVVAAVWPPGYASPIHDHVTWCAFGVFEGIVRETRFRAVSAAPAAPQAVATGHTDWRPGAATSLPAGADIHCMHNPTGRPAISVHVYGGNAGKLGPNVARIYREAAAAVA